MMRNTVKLGIGIVTVGFLFFIGISTVLIQEAKGQTSFSNESYKELEAKFNKLTEDVSRIIEERDKEKAEITLLKQRLETLTKELRASKGEKSEEKPTATTSRSSIGEAPSDEHLYFEGLGVNENLPGRAISLDKLRVRLWLQYRVMYNASNIPGPGGTNFGDTENYDFLRQRMRVGLDVRPFENVGGYAQFEYRGGFGVGPGISDPRAGIDLDNIAFNRLSDRGLRYAYLYASPIKEATIAAGILPSSDYLGDTLFSADWDFNVGGLAVMGVIGDFAYRLSYLRLIEGLGFDSVNALGKDSHLALADFTVRLPDYATTLGLHVYYLRNDIDEPAIGDFQEAWIGVSGKTNIASLGLNGFVILNAGKFDSPVSLPSGLMMPEGSHQGIAVKAEGTLPLYDLSAGPLVLSGQFIFASGDKEGDMDSRFNTIQGLIGTQGYWGYTHIFNANGPSDVNDLGLDIGNTRLGGGAGLITAQIKLMAQFPRHISLEMESGSFWSASKRAGNRYMGTEVGGMFTIPIVEPLRLQVGMAYARLGGFFESIIAEEQGLDKNVYELFSRLQLEF